MNIPKELVDQWEIDWQDPDAKGSLNEYIAQRAYDYALEQAAKVCETLDPVCYDTAGYMDCAAAIRALKEVQS